jgi:methylenetetrahydrofolate reductase (NADPH)
MHISIELVPRDIARLQTELASIRDRYSRIDTVNIPDLLRLPVRSWEGTAAAKPYFSRAIPHVRAIDFDVRKPWPLLPHLEANGIGEVLVVTGDPPTDMSRQVYGTTSIDLIRKLKLEAPDLKVYAALDPYRSSIREEADYVRRKLDAGADGFFTQPFFDARLMGVYAELLEGSEVYWGVSPVMTSASRSYWETKNNAVFPQSFTPTMDWNTSLAREALAFAEEAGGHAYFMPIKVDLDTYLSGIFGDRP